MNQKFFDRYQIDIGNIGKENLMDYASALEKKTSKYFDDVKKSIKQLVIIMSAFYLINGSIIRELKVGPFEIDRIYLILNFIPVAVVFTMNTIISKYSEAIQYNYLLSRILRRHYKLNETSALLSTILPLKSERASFQKVNKKTKFDLWTCLFKVPVILILFFIGILIIPGLYYFVIMTTINNFHSGNGITLWTFWLPTIYMGLLIWLGISNIIDALNFIRIKSMLADEEELQRSKSK